MLRRRLTGFFLTLLTLHLNLLGADFACAKHGPANGDGATEHAMVTPATASSHAHGATSVATKTAIPSHGSVSPAAVTNEQPPCDVPVQPNCCKALASCSVVFSNSNSLDVAGVLKGSELIAPNAMAAPPSERAAPEPPPPKA